MDTALLLAAIAIPLWLNIKASLLIARDTFSERPQKIAQLLLVWLMPLLGAMIVLGIHRRPEKSSGKYPDESHWAQDHMGAGGGGVGRSVAEAIDGD